MTKSRNLQFPVVLKEVTIQHPMEIKDRSVRLLGCSCEDYKREEDIKACAG